MVFCIFKIWGAVFVPCLSGKYGAKCRFKCRKDSIDFGLSHLTQLKLSQIVCLPQDRLSQVFETPLLIPVRNPGQMDMCAMETGNEVISAKKVSSHQTEINHLIIFRSGYATKR